MNAAVRAVVRTAVSFGAPVKAASRGYQGLIEGDIRELTATSVSNIIQRGGTILQTRRSQRFMEPRGQREAIRRMNEAGVDGLIVIGGDGSLRGAQALSTQGIKVVGIPASIDNDIWGSDMAIGVDTALNTIMDAVDKLRDTASSHNRAFLIETMGRNSGYLAVMAAIVCGAEIVLVPEVTSTVDEVVAGVALAPVAVTGLARQAEPDPGVWWDPLALVAAGGALISVLALAAVTSWWTDRPARDRDTQSRPSRLVGAAAAAGSVVSAARRSSCPCTRTTATSASSSCCTRGCSCRAPRCPASSAPPPSARDCWSR